MLFIFRYNPTFCVGERWYRAVSWHGPDIHRWHNHTSLQILHLCTHSLYSGRMYQ